MVEPRFFDSEGTAYWLHPIDDVEQVEGAFLEGGRAAVPVKGSLGALDADLILGESAEVLQTGV